MCPVSICGHVVENLLNQSSVKLGGGKNGPYWLNFLGYSKRLSNQFESIHWHLTAKLGGIEGSPNFSYLHILIRKPPNCSSAKMCYTLYRTLMLLRGPQASSVSITQELVKMQKPEPLLHPHLHVKKIPWVLPMCLTFCKRLVKSSHPQSVLSRQGTSASPKNLVEMQNHGLILHLLSPKF